MGSSVPSPDGIASASADARRIAPHAAVSLDLQERERIRIAFDLHDGPAQTMSAALLQIRMLPREDGHALRKGLDELHATMALALDEIYGLIESLGGRNAKDTGLVSRVRACVATFTERFGIDVDLTVDGDCGPASPSLQIATFRIVQEALSNIGRHAGASHVAVALRLSADEMYCEITDDGKGFDPGAIKRPGRRREAFGLRSMKERAQMLNGECVVESSPGRGARVLVKIPVWRS